MKRTMQIREPSGQFTPFLPKVPILYPRPGYSNRKEDNPTNWDSTSIGQHTTFHEFGEQGGKRRKSIENEFIQQQYVQHIQNQVYSPVQSNIQSTSCIAESDRSSDVGESSSPCDKYDDEPLKKVHGKKRNRMKDEIDSLRNEITSMTKHIDYLRLSQESQLARRHQNPLWADIAKQQALELSRATTENQHLRQTLEDHLEIAQEYIDTIIPKHPNPPTPPTQPATTDVTSLPIIMCL